jgi:hypothetical protein
MGEIKVQESKLEFRRSSLSKPACLRMCGPVGWALMEASPGLPGPNKPNRTDQHTQQRPPVFSMSAFAFSLPSISPAKETQASSPATLSACLARCAIRVAWIAPLAVLIPRFARCCASSS